MEPASPSMPVVDFRLLPSGPLWAEGLQRTTDDGRAGAGSKIRRVTRRFRWPVGSKNKGSWIENPRTSSEAERNERG